MFFSYINLNFWSRVLED